MARESVDVPAAQDPLNQGGVAAHLAYGVRPELLIDAVRLLLLGEFLAGLPHALVSLQERADALAAAGGSTREPRNRSSARAEGLNANLAEGPVVRPQQILKRGEEHGFETILTSAPHREEFQDAQLLAWARAPGAQREEVQGSQLLVCAQAPDERVESFRVPGDVDDEMGHSRTPSYKARERIRSGYEVSLID
jgi:hypothetical protein